MPEATGRNRLAIDWLPASEEERAIIRLRDSVFGVPITVGEWLNCGTNWMRPDSIEWLREKSKRVIVV